MSQISPEANGLIRELIIATLSELEQDDEIDALRSFIERLEQRAEEYQTERNERDAESSLAARTDELEELRADNATLRDHIERGKDLLQSAYTRSSIEDRSPLSVEICHYLHVEKP
jgi:septal ring factor EnvC (AmiA/AmiB activator)